MQWSVGKANEKSYYNTQRTAQIEITEENFEPSSVKWEMQGKAQVGKWKSKGNTHSCQVVFSEDGSYGLHFSCEDKAGNKEKYEEKENFVIDRTAPVIEVFYEDEVLLTSGILIILVQLKLLFVSKILMKIRLK